jgi:hypothetical protein
MNSVLVSESTAKALFGDKEAIGATVRIDNKVDVSVTGVYKDLPFNTDFRDLMFIAPWDLYVSSQPWVQRARDEGQWGNNSFQTYVQIADNTDFSTVNRRIINSKLFHMDPED